MMVEPDTRQEQRVDVPVVDLLNRICFTRPQPHLAARKPQRLRQRRSPCPAPNHADAIELHWILLNRYRWDSNTRLQACNVPKAAKPADSQPSDIYAFTPAPIAGGAEASSGHRGRTGASRPSASPRASRSAPAQAIIAPLSPHSATGGTFRMYPAS